MVEETHSVRGAIALRIFVRNGKKRGEVGGESQLGRGYKPPISIDQVFDCCRCRLLIPSMGV